MHVANPFLLVAHCRKEVVDLQLLDVLSNAGWEMHLVRRKRMQLNMCKGTLAMVSSMPARIVITCVDVAGPEIPCFRMCYIRNPP